MSSNTEESAKSAFALDEKPAKPANQLEMDEQPPTKNAAVARLEAWCGETTLHGVSNIVKDDHWTAYKIVWIVIVVLAIGANMYHLYTVIYGYLQYPTTVWPDVAYFPVMPDSWLVRHAHYFVDNRVLVFNYPRYRTG